MPEPRIKSVTITAFVNSWHASDNRTRRPRIWYFIFLNRAPIIFYSKRQSTVESITFSSEFIGMKTRTEHTIGLGLRLKMFGIDIYGTAIMLNYSKSAVNNNSKNEYTLNKKHS